MKSSIRHKAIQLGAYRCGFALAQKVSGEAATLYRQWIARGCHGEMAYCANYLDQRDDPRLLLDGARTVISCAFPYPAAEPGPIASYAHVEDYHIWVKAALKCLGQWIEETYGGATRACVDTAPIRERYWAQQAGIGYVGINNQLIIPGAGSRFFLGELLWTGALTPDEPCAQTCGNCQACVRACPGHAIDGHGACDARRCISYLTIEHRGPLPPTANLAGHIYGCDACLNACPHNSSHNPAQPIATPIDLSQPIAAPVDLAQPIAAPVDLTELSDPAALQTMTPSHYRKLTARSAMRRAPLPQLLRNLQQIYNEL